MEQALQTFKQNVTSLFAQYGRGDVNYTSANVQLDLKTDELLAAHAVDMPDSIMDEAFKAFADLHVQAAQHHELTPAEASHIIHDRATDFFEDSRGWEAVETIVKPYWAQIERLEQ